MKRRPWTIVASLGAALLLAVIASGDRWTHLAPVCVFHELTGLDCPGCGGTRCAVRLLHGDLPGALRMNAFTVLFGFLLAVYLVMAVWREWHDAPAPRVPVWLAWTVLGLFLAFGALRNLPWYPFTLLAPH